MTTFVAGALLLGVTVAQAAGTPQQQCQVAKHKAVGKYVACRQNVEAKLVASGNTEAYGQSILRCEYRFASLWEQAEAKAKAVDATCLDAPLTEGDFQTILDASTSNITTALAGLGLTDCSADLASCAGDLDICSGDLGTCTTDLTQATTDLTTCNGTVTTLSANLSTCNGGLTTCNGSLGTCTTNLATANGSLTTCNGSLGTCNAALTISNGIVTTLNGNLSTCNASLGSCTTDLATAQLCGNGITDPGEDCDFGTLNGKTCMTQGFDGGILACGAGCEFDTGGCYMRFVDNGDGTVSDNVTGLMWEKKTTTVGSGVNLTDPHDVDNKYSWSVTWDTSPPANGTAFTDFLVRLNTIPCFAGYCDWRLPSEEGRNSPFTGAKELESILLAPYPCGTSPCIDPIFGPTDAEAYWSATTSATSPFYAWFVYFDHGWVDILGKPAVNVNVRAVRGGS